jgi:hypothetical protein
MASLVAQPLERQFADLPGVSQITSSNVQGTTSITLVFDLSRNIDAAAADVQAAINAAGGLVGLLQVLQNLHAPLLVAAADLGQADPPGGAVQQEHAERVFQRLDLVADRRLREPQAVRWKRSQRPRPNANPQEPGTILRRSVNVLPFTVGKESLRPWLGNSLGQFLIADRRRHLVPSGSVGTWIQS